MGSGAKNCVTGQYDSKMCQVFHKVVYCSDGFTVWRDL